MKKYPGPERRREQSKAEEVRGLALRMIRERVPFNDMVLRGDDKPTIVKQMRRYLGGLVGSIGPNAKSFPRLRATASWVLPGSDMQAKMDFIEFLKRRNSVNTRAVFITLGKRGMGQDAYMTFEDLLKAVQEMIPDADVASLKATLASYEWQYTFGKEKKFYVNSEMVVTDEGLRLAEESDSPSCPRAYFVERRIREE